MENNNQAKTDDRRVSLDPKTQRTEKRSEEEGNMPIYNQSYLSNITKEN